MTRQTAAPIEHVSLQPSFRRATELVRDVDGGVIDLDPPYQRGAVWDASQRIALVESWLRGIPSGVLTLSDRGQDAWRRHTGVDVYATGVGIWACVDGKQRLTTARLWLRGEFSVPASWFEARYVAAVEETGDGPYVRHTGLTEQGRRMVESRALLQVAVLRTARTVEDEARVYLLVNSGGTPHSVEDLERARGVAQAP